MRRAHASGRVRAVPLFVGSYLAVWTLVGVAVYALYRPHGSFAAGAVAIAAGVYEFTPLKQHFRRRCRESVRSGFEFGLYCVGSSIGLMLMLVALGVMSVTWMSVIAVLVLAQKLLPAESRHRCAAGAGDRRTWNPDRHRALVGSRTHATDVRRQRWRGPRQAVVTTRRRETMTDHKTGTREEWLAARLELLEAEKELTRRSDELARQRQELPWVRIDKEYRFDTDEGTRDAGGSVRGRSQLLVYHFMFGPDYKAGCPSCSAIADGFNGSVVHLANHDVTLCAVSRAPLAKLQAYKRRMGWSFPWASSFGSDFNYDFHVAHTEEQWQSGAVEYNFRSMDVRPLGGRRGESHPHRDRVERRHGLADVRREAARHERVRARGRRRLPHLLGVRARGGRPLGHVPVARPRAARAQRDRPLVAPPRRVRQRVSTRSDGTF